MLAQLFSVGAWIFAALPAEAMTLTDPTFSPGDWSQAIIAQTGPTPSFSAGQVASGGNPGFYRSISHSYGGNGSIITGHWYTGATYAPGVDGALGSVSFSFDANVFDAGQSGAVAFGALMQQAGNTYIGGFAVLLPSGWQSLSFPTLTAAGFSKIAGAGPSTPDFSAGGAAIQFGFYASNGTGLASQTGTSSGVDNWSVTTLPSASVADGSPALVFLAGLLALAFCHRRSSIS